MGRPPIDLTGKKFGRLTAIKVDESKPPKSGKHKYWICQCECGNSTSVNSNALLMGRIKSCGCLLRERNPNKYKAEGDYIRVYFNSEKGSFICPPGLVRDHINRDKMDNRKANFRILTIPENMQNSDYFDEIRKRKYGQDKNREN